MRTIRTESAPAPVQGAPYSQAAAAAPGDGEVVWVSGQLGIDPGDGTKDGFDVELLAAVAVAAPVPVIASGGAGTLAHFADAVVRGRADAVLAASVFHDGVYSIAQVKAAMDQAGVPVRQ